MSYHSKMTDLWHDIAPLSKFNPHTLATRLKQEFGTDLPLAALAWHAEQVRAGATDKKVSQMTINDAFRFLSQQCQAQRDLRGTETARVAPVIEASADCACRSGWISGPKEHSLLPCLQCALGQSDYWAMRNMYNGKQVFQSQLQVTP